MYARTLPSLLLPAPCTVTFLPIAPNNYPSWTISRRLRILQHYRTHCLLLQQFTIIVFVPKEVKG